MFDCPQLEFFVTFLHYEFIYQVYINDDFLGSPWDHSHLLNSTTNFIKPHFWNTSQVSQLQCWSQLGLFQPSHHGGLTLLLRGKMTVSPVLRDLPLVTGPLLAMENPISVMAILTQWPFLGGRCLFSRWAPLLFVIFWTPAINWAICCDAFCIYSNMKQILFQQNG